VARAPVSDWGLLQDLVIGFAGMVVLVAFVTLIYIALNG
jgi:hypothetical protein